jgi:hypothetical protein
MGTVETVQMLLNAGAKIANGAPLYKQARPHGPGLAVDQWRLWVEDRRVIEQDFWNPFGDTMDPLAGLMKREDNPNAKFLVGDGFTDTTLAGPSSTEEATTSSATFASDTITTEPSAAPTTTQTTEASTRETSESSTAESTAESTGETTTTELSTTLRTSFITTTSEATTTTTTESTETFTGPYPFFNYGGPKVATPYCACKTITAGQTFMTSAPLISGQCHYYHTYPASVTLVPTESLPPPEPKPITVTRQRCHPVIPRPHDEGWYLSWRKVHSYRRQGHSLDDPTCNTQGNRHR